MCQRARGPLAQFPIVHDLVGGRLLTRFVLATGTADCLIQSYLKEQK
jgi:hypothetical protein